MTISISTRLSLILNRVLPLALLLDLAQRTDRVSPPKQRTHRLYTIWEPLQLAYFFARSANITEETFEQLDLWAQDRLGLALGLFASSAVLPDLVKANYAREVFGRATGVRAQSQMSHSRMVLDAWERDAKSGRSIAHLMSILRYSAATRGAWLDKYRETAVEPLAGVSLKSLVRNSDPLQLLNLLSLDGDDSRSTRLDSSAIGRMRFLKLQALAKQESIEPPSSLPTPHALAETPLAAPQVESVVTAVTPAVPVTVETAETREPGVQKVPSGVSLEVTPDALIKVSAVVRPRRWVDQKQLDTLFANDGGTPSNVHAALKHKSREEVCAPADLCAVLSRMSDWMTQVESDERFKVQAAVDQALAAVKRKRLQTSVLDTLSAEDRLLLRALLNEQAEAIS